MMTVLSEIAISSFALRTNDAAIVFGDDNCRRTWASAIAFWPVTGECANSRAIARVLDIDEHSL